MIYAFHPEAAAEYAEHVAFYKRYKQNSERVSIRQLKQ